MMMLEGRVALVTGAQQGIGKAVAEAMGREGASVVVQYFDDIDAANEVAALVRSYGPDAVVVQGDVGVRGDCEAALNAGRELGGVNLLVNNAGIFPRRSFVDMTDDDWNNVQNVNVVGGFRCLQLMARDLITDGRQGTAVNLSSVAFFRNSAQGAHYAASKGAIIGFTRAVSTELAPHGIRVNAIAPGIVDTAQPRDGMTEQQIAAASARVPLGAMATPDEVADVAVFLSSHLSRHITGQTLQVNGGTNFS
jgi:NAD(P)-dependent dehydrogenase (short-subunit alcohol dehydrogenase family)